MDLIDRLTELAKRAEKVAGQLETEEATKNALIMPLINALGYDVFDPTVVVPEFVADVGVKKGEKVDYAVMSNGVPTILFECKTYGINLDKEHASQLYRYFSVTDARFGVLTDGRFYRFYSDLESPNKMDELPFFEFDLFAVNDTVADELKKFSRESFDVENILSTATDLKYKKAFKRILGEEWVNPSEDLIKLLASRVYSGRLTQGMRDQFAEIVRIALHEFVSDRVNKRLQSALDRDTSDESQAVETASSTSDEGIETTEDEIEGYYIVKAIVREVVDGDRVFMRDTQSYCGVLLDDNNRKPICRLFFNNSSRKFLGVMNEDKSVTRHPIDQLDDIYDFSDQLKASARKYAEGDSAVAEAESD